MTAPEEGLQWQATRHCHDQHFISHLKEDTEGTSCFLLAPHLCGSLGMDGEGFFCLQAPSYLSCVPAWRLWHLHAWGTFDQSEAASPRCAGTSLTAMPMVLSLCALLGEGLCFLWATFVPYPKLPIESGEEGSKHGPFCQGTAYSPGLGHSVGTCTTMGLPGAHSQQGGGQGHLGSGIASVRAGPVQ